MHLNVKQVRKTDEYVNYLKKVHQSAKDKNTNTGLNTA